MRDGFSRWSAGLLPARLGFDYGFRGGRRGSILHAVNSHQWDSPRGKCPLPTDVPLEGRAHAPSGSGRRKREP